MSKTHIYFASDFHLGAPNEQKSKEREGSIIDWLNQIEETAKEIYLIGDIFDFWFEYKTVVPKGYIRFLGKIASLTDKGIPVHFFTGNHDMWMFDYLEKEIGVSIHRKPILKEWNGKTFLIGHGDGLGPGDHLYKFLKLFFNSSICQWLFARLHPNFGISLAGFWSKRSRASTGTKEDYYLGDDKEFLVSYIKDYLNSNSKQPDYFIFGHRHLSTEKKVGSALYINTGDWIKHFTYSCFDGINTKLLTYSPYKVL